MLLKFTDANEAADEVNELKKRPRTILGALRATLPPKFIS